MRNHLLQRSNELYVSLYCGLKNIPQRGAHQLQCKEMYILYNMVSHQASTLITWVTRKQVAVSAACHLYVLVTGTDLKVQHDISVLSQECNFMSHRGSEKILLLFYAFKTISNCQCHGLETIDGLWAYSAVISFLLTLLSTNVWVSTLTTARWYGLCLNCIQW